MRRSKGWRAVAAAAVMVASATLATTPQVRATDLDAPILLGPADGSSPGLDVTFHWERLPWAVAYHIQVRLNDGAGTLYVDDRTVNDQIAEHVPMHGAVAYWSLAGVDQDGIEGPTSSATFKSADLAPTLLAPPDGAVLTYPDVTPEIRWRSAGEDFEYPYADQDIGASDFPCCGGNGPGVGSTRPFGPGDWRWAAGGIDVPAELPTPELSEIRGFTVVWRDSAPRLTSPADGATIPASQTIHLAWDHVPGATSYQWQFEPEGNAFPTLSQYDTGLSPNWGDVLGYFGHVGAGTYRWRVRALMPSDSPTMIHGPWSETRTLVVGPLTTPTATYPTDAATLSDWPTLAWTPVAGNPNYEIDISNSPGPGDVTQTVVPAFTFLAPGPGVAMLRWSPGLVTRWWRVRAFQGDTGPGASDWTPWHSFTVTPSGATLAAPEVATPTGPATCLTEATCPHIPGIPILRWNAVDGAAFYRVFYSADGGTQFSNQLDVGGTSLVLPWYAQTPADRWLGWSVVACPSTDDCPSAMPASPSHLKVGLPAPTPLAPADGATQAASSARITWALPAPSADPEVMIPTVNAETDTHVAYSDGSPASSGAVYGTTTAGTLMSLPPASILSWRVRVATLATETYHLIGAWSATRTIQRDAPMPTVLTPAEGAVVGASPLLSWTLPGYEIGGFSVEVVRGTPAADSLAWSSSPWRFYADGATAVPFPELPPGTYSWRVSSERDPVDPTAVPIHHFVVAGDEEIQLLDPADGASVRADSVVLSWSPVTAASVYTVQIGTAPDVTASQIYVGGGLALTEHAVAMRLPDGPLYWRVCAYLQNSTSFSCSATSTLAVGPSAVRLLNVFAPPGPSDVLPPVSSGLSVSPRGAATLGSTGVIPARITWSASDVGTGIGHQELEMSRDTGTFVPIAVSDTSRAADVLLSPGHQYHFRTRATDLAANVGAWATLTLGTKLVQDSSSWAWSSGWTKASSTSASGGSTRWATRAGATATITVTARSIAFVAPRSTTRGKAEIWIDGVNVATINLAASPLGQRRLVFVKAWSSVGTHKVRIRVTGYHHARVDVDALIVLR